MTKANTSFTDFSAGEISPKLYGRFDLATYYSGHKRIENFEVESVGQASFRYGLNYSAETAGNNPAFLYVWSYDDSLSFVLEFTDGKLRFYRNNGIVETAPDTPYELAVPYATADVFDLKFAQNGLDLYITHPSHPPKTLTYVSATNWTLTDHAPIRETFENSQRISATTLSDPIVVTYTGVNNYANGDDILITGVSGMTELNDKRFKVSNVNVGAKTFELQDSDSVDVDGTGYTAYSSGGIIQEITETAAPFIAVDEYPSCVTFYEDRLVYGGSKNKPSTLYFSRSAKSDDFTLGEEVDDGMEYVVSGDGNTIKWMRGTNKFLAIGTFGDVLQATGGIDGVITPSSISIKPSNSYGVANINPLGKNTQIFYLQNDNLILRSFEFKFEIDSYIPVDRNIISEHITKSGVKQISFQEGRPNILWAVKNNGDLVGMTIEESEGVSGWHRASTQGEFVSIASLPRANSNMQLWVCVKRNINGVDKYYIEYKNDAVDFPVRSDFINNTKEIDDIAYKNMMFEAQKQYIFVDSSLTFNGTVTGIDAGASVTPAAVTGSGVTFTASAAAFVAGDVGREIWNKSVTGVETGRAVITGYTSSTVVTCDILSDFNSTDAMPSGGWYLTAMEIAGLGHLEGEEVTIIADGGQHSLKTVSSGSITLDRQVSVCHVGIGYKGYIETNSLEGGGTNGTAQTKKKSVNAIGVRFLNSMFAKVGTGYYNLSQVYERTAAMDMDRPPLPFTGDRKIKTISNNSDLYDGGWQREKNVVISQEQPFPCNVQLIIPYMDTSNV